MSTKNRPVETSPLYDAAWATAQRLGTFTYHDLAAEAAISVERATDFVQHWERARAVEFLGLGTKRRKEWKVIAMALPPRSHADGSAIRTSTVQGNLWRAIRGFRAFSAVDLAAHSNTPEVAVTPEAAREYCQMLTRAGYLRVERPAIPGRREAVYRLIKNTGPRPPMERRVRAVFDENLGEIVHVAGVPT